MLVVVQGPGPRVASSHAWGLAGATVQLRSRRKLHWDPHMPTKRTACPHGPVSASNAAQHRQTHWRTLVPDFRAKQRPDRPPLSSGSEHGRKDQKIFPRSTLTSIPDRLLRIARHVQAVTVGRDTSHASHGHQQASHGAPLTPYAESSLSVQAWTRLCSLEEYAEASL